VFRFFHSLACYVALAIMVPRWLHFLWSHRTTLSDADIVVTMNTPRAFGTLFAMIDDARRLYSGRNIVFIYHREASGHNPLLGLCFSDITLLDVPRRDISFDIVGRTIQLPPNSWHDPMSFAATSWWVERFGKIGVRSICGFDIWHEIELPEEYAAALPKVIEGPAMRPGPLKRYCKQHTAFRVGTVDIINELHMYGAWNIVRANTDAPTMRLPEKLQDPISDALLKARGPRDALLCGLHTRYGGLDDKIHRDGSPIEFYIPALHALVERGYQVLIQGDRSLHPRVLETFDGMVVDTESLNVDKNAFRLFCGTESDIFIGDWPVAPQLAATNDIPTLVVNAWPIGWGINGATVYYRGVCGSDGKRWAWDRSLSQGALLNCNTTPHHFPELYGENKNLFSELTQIAQMPLDDQEILEAVTDFVNNLWSIAPEDQAHLTDLMPLWTPFRMSSDCRLSPAWIRRYVDAAADPSRARA
jgi:hypothetical protein